MAITIQVVVDPKLKREILSLAKAEKRSLSNMVVWLLALGKLKYYEQDQARQPKEQVIV